MNTRFKFKIGSQTLILVSTLYFTFGLNWALWRYFYDKVSFDNPLFCLALPILLCLPLFLFFNLVIVPKLAKPLLITFLLLSSATNHLMYNLGVYIDKDMLRNAVETNVREASDFFTLTGFLWVLATGIAPIILLLMTKIEFSPARQELKKRLLSVGAGLALAGVSAALSYKDIVAVGRNHKPARKIINTVNYVYSTFRYVQNLKPRHFTVLEENIPAVRHQTPRVLVLVIGETARAANFSLNGYARKTNPLLEKQDIVYYKDTAACGTATAISLPCLFSHLPRGQFDAGDAKYTENLTDFLRKAGYDVLWVENDDGCKGVCSRIKTRDVVEEGHPRFCFKNYCWDDALLAGLENDLNAVEKDTVIVLHTMGSHGPAYYLRYPERFKAFQPTCDTADIQKCAQDAIVNTYDNTILYTDFIVSSAIDVLKKFPQFESGLIYVSDHGESLGENNIYLHGCPYAIAPKEQKNVPMLLWLNQPSRERVSDYACLKRQAAENAFSHDWLFHSVLGFTDVKSKFYDEKLDLFKPCALTKGDKK